MKRHDSMRGWVAYELYQQMKKNKNIILVTGDLGYGMFDAIRDEMPDQFINTGAAELAMMDIAVGLALTGKRPVVYSITPFLLYRPFETIRTYINHEKIPVIMLGGGRDDDYKHDGFSHYAGDDKDFMKQFKDINVAWPKEKDEAVLLFQIALKAKEPYYINLRR